MFNPQSSPENKVYKLSLLSLRESSRNPSAVQSLLKTASVSGVAGGWNSGQDIIVNSEKAPISKLWEILKQYEVSQDDIGQYEQNIRADLNNTLEDLGSTRVSEKGINVEIDNEQMTAKDFVDNELEMIEEMDIAKKPSIENCLRILKVLIFGKGEIEALRKVLLLK